MASTTGDRVVVAVTEDMAFRVIAARTTETVEKAMAAQKVSGETARHFAELMTGVILVRVALAPRLRVQGILQGDQDSGRMVADAHPEGWVRGLVRKDEGAEITFGDKALLQVMRSLPTGELQQGVVQVPVEGGISASLTTYLAHSEQVLSHIDVACAFGEGGRVVSGGYLLQPMPGVPEGPLAVMTARLNADFVDLAGRLGATDAAPEALIDDMLYGMPYHDPDTTPLSFGCNCSDTRVLASLSTLGKDDLRELIQMGKRLDMTCEYCHTQYKVEPEVLRGLLDES